MRFMVECAEANLGRIQKEWTEWDRMICEKNYAALYGGPEAAQRCNLLVQKLRDALAGLSCIREERPSGDPADVYPDAFARSMREAKEARIAEVSAALDRMIDAHTQCVVEFRAAGKDARWDAIMETLSQRFGLTAVDYMQMAYQLREESPDVALRVVEVLAQRYRNEHHDVASAYLAAYGETERYLDKGHSVSGADPEQIRKLAIATWGGPLKMHLLIIVLKDTRMHEPHSNTYNALIEELSQMSCRFEIPKPKGLRPGITNAYAAVLIEDIIARYVTVREVRLRKFGKWFSRFIPVRGWKDRFEKWTGADV